MKFRSATCSGLLQALVLGLAALSLLIPERLPAHGTMHIPTSRVAKCRFQDNPENPQDPACAAAVAETGNPQFLYDWAGIRQADANGQHQTVVPDGQLCAGGGAEYAGLDLIRSDWRTTRIEADSDGNFEFVYEASAPHGTRDMIFYITRQGWNPSQGLSWSDLDFVDEPDNPTDPVDPFCHLFSAPLTQYPGIGDAYRMTCPLPERTGHHVVYHVWQRDDSPEAFYACVDVVIDSDSMMFSNGFEAGAMR